MPPPSPARRGAYRLEFSAYVFLILVALVAVLAAPPGPGRKAARRPLPVPAPVTPAPAPPPPAPARPPAEREPGLEVDVKEKVQDSAGTAFAIRDGHTYVTARHVVEGCRAVYLMVGPRQFRPVQGWSIMATRDFAVLQVDFARSGVLFLSTEAPEPGTEGFMMGFPQSTPADVRATVLGQTEMRSRGRYSMREPVVVWAEVERRPDFDGTLAGLSGGPVLDGQGRVVGTVVAASPRRGRAVSTHPQVFSESGMAGMGAGRHDAITPENFDSIGQAHRADGSVTQVYCKVR